MRGSPVLRFKEKSRIRFDYELGGQTKRFAAKHCVFFINLNVTDGCVKLTPVKSHSKSEFSTIA